MRVRVTICAIAFLGAVASGRPDAWASPSSVTVTGDLQSEAGCPTDFDPACALTHMVQSSADSIWRFSESLPTGNYQYLAALNDSFAERYGKNATLSGPQIDLSIPSGPSTVRFYYDDITHWITDNRNAVIATAVGDFQSELGCPTDFDPSCLRSWLEDPDGDGIYRFVTSALPAGTYEVLVTYDESFDVKFGQGGVQDGPQFSFTVPEGAATCFTFSPVTHILDISTNGCPSVAAVPQPTSLLIVCLSFVAMTALPAFRRKGQATEKRY